jgi:UBX domain-containing protein 7
MTENISEQAIQLYFDSPDLASGVGQSTQPSAPPIPSSTRPPRATSVGREDSRGVVHLDDDDEDMVDVDDDEERDGQATSAAAISQAADYEDDEAIARRMQEELYAGGDASGGFGADGVRAPIGRTTETLVGGPGGAWGPENMQAAVQQQMRLRQARASGTSPLIE